MMGEEFPEFSASLMDIEFDGSFGAVHVFGDFLDAHVFHVEEQDRGTLSRRELGKRPVDFLEHLALIDKLSGVRSGRGLCHKRFVGHINGFFEGNSRHSTGSGSVGHALVNDDARGPRGEFFGFFEASDVAINPHQAFLEDFLGVIGIAHQRVNPAKQVLLN